jgi:hypothetical protein
MSSVGGIDLINEPALQCLSFDLEGRSKQSRLDRPRLEEKMDSADL